MKRPLLLLAGAIAAIVLLLVLTGGPRRAIELPDDSFGFAVIADAPYYPWEARQYEIVLEELALNDLAWVLHVGDLFWRPCDEARYRRSRREFDALPHPVIYTPGDNEWTDCWRAKPGGYAPLGRLQLIREIFFDDPYTSLGGTSFPLESQADDARFDEFVENARWRRDGVLFATAHVVGSGNGTQSFKGRTELDDAYVDRRSAAAIAWIVESFDIAIAEGALAIVIALHAEMLPDSPLDDPERAPFDAILLALEEQSERYGGPVLLIHGDDHEYRVDHPLERRTTGRTLENFTRMEVPGSPEVGWVHVTVRPGADPPFSFTPQVVPRWKYW